MDHSFELLAFGACALSIALVGACSSTGGNTNDAGSDAGLEADAPAATYSALDDKSKWTVYSPVGTTDIGYQGVAFDGRYMYFAPTALAFPGTIQRYDTQGPFDVQASWASFDQTTVSASSTAFGGIVFDGRYMYFVPGTPSAEAGQGVALRYDVQAGFTDKASWASYDLATTDPAAKGFSGGTFDGRYVYFAPFQDSLNLIGHTVRYDTTAAFTAKGSWTSVDLKKFQTNADAFSGAAYDGRYVYYAPSGGVFAMQYDTQAGFNTLAAWTPLDPSTIGDGQSTLFQGAVYDGRFLYLVPGLGAEIARFDSQSALGFGAAASWQLFDAHTVNAGTGGFLGGVYDGRYVYFIPEVNSSSLSGYLTRVDTTTEFSNAASWFTFDISALDPNAQGFSTGGFDGRYVYFASNFSGLMARFDAVSPASLPAIPGGSSF